ncbi:MAG: PfkB family carbohydrate kinase [Planctomycetota bacterium]|jgi:fructokinase|nr:PfkB family carbohydrate kinase [Planctomycetota bacterium]
MTKQPVTISVGEVLWDMLPDGKVLGGSPTNVAWHMAQLGAEAHVVTAVGADPLGDEILRILGAMPLHIDTISVIDGRPTSTVDCVLDAAGNASYVFHRDEAWDFLPATAEALALAARADGVNYGSLSQRSPRAQEATFKLLDATPADCVRVFDINLRPPFVSERQLTGGMERAVVLKMNDAELPMVAGVFGWDREANAAMDKLFGRFPNLKHIVVTRGPEGAWWNDRKRLASRTPDGDIRKVDTIGAGDAFTASVLMGLLKGWDVDAIMDRALGIASFVCTRRGGTPELPDALKSPFLA